jgi:3-oxoacyl-[acyl-carrier protein] reductase
MENGGLSGRVALVTGANHGIGAAIARRLARSGAAVLATYLTVDDAEDPGTPATYRTNRAKDASEVVAAIESDGGRVLAVQADLRDTRVVPRLFDEAEAAFGSVDILINNASGWAQDTFRPEVADGFGRSMQPVTADSVDHILDVDARAAALLIAEFARRHVARSATWGRIVGLTSGGPDGFPAEVSYGAAKAAQVNYTMSAATELADFGITANMVHPPVTDTGWVTDAVREAVRTSDRLVHVAHPDEVAAVVALLLSDEAQLVTGNVISLR